MIGVVSEVQELTSVTARSSGNQIPKRTIVLVDDSNTTVEVTLWGKKAEDYNHPGNPVVAIKG